MGRSLRRSAVVAGLLASLLGAQWIAGSDARPDRLVADGAAAPAPSRSAAPPPGTDRGPAVDVGRAGDGVGDASPAAAGARAAVAPTSPTAAPAATAAPAPAERATAAPPPRQTPRAARSTRSAAAAPPAETGDAALGTEVLGLVNAERAAADCPAVTLDERLSAAATGHSRDMAARSYFSHTSQDGRTFADRIRATGYGAPRSENIAAGQATPADVMRSWMDSDGHRANILDCTATEMGLGVGRGGDYGIYWTQVFGTG